MVYRCYECGDDIGSRVTLSENYRPILLLDKVKWDNDALLISSDKAYALCTNEYKRKKNLFVRDYKKITGILFFSISGLPIYIKGYRRMSYMFLTLENAKKALPKTIEDFLNSKESIWEDFEEQRKIENKIGAHLRRMFDFE